MNRVILIGRLTRDPDLRYTQSGMAVCSFTLAVDKNLSKQKRQEAESQNRPTADFPRVTFWGAQGETIAKYLRKGQQLAIEGRIQTGSYQDQNGNTVYTTDVVGDKFDFINSSNQNFGYQNDSNGFNQDNNSMNFNQDFGNSYKNNDNQSNNDEDFFGDDFSQIEDDGRIPF
ncbi:MAG: single-stranded DNA-binding protein [Peptoniphilaceae bacterium]|nr:single-stranded DNA-binding protein [Peptoniphilaceae bacterium]MDD7383191.1 single-stranded DNA-binding protein [Peptoniphilaceae bacterium]MDY3738415.1 single-stranded DNA-binding protein [Peptoniphilaceae bacterium]